MERTVRNNLIEWYFEKESRYEKVSWAVMIIIAVGIGTMCSTYDKWYHIVGYVFMFVFSLLFGGWQTYMADIIKERVNVRFKKEHGTTQELNHKKDLEKLQEYYGKFQTFALMRAFKLWYQLNINENNKYKYLAYSDFIQWCAQHIRAPLSAKAGIKQTDPVSLETYIFENNAFLYKTIRGKNIAFSIDHRRSTGDIVRTTFLIEITTGDISYMVDIHQAFCPDEDYIPIISLKPISAQTLTMHPFDDDINYKDFIEK